MQGGYQRYLRGIARKNGRMTELRTKRVTHAQFPYITVGACKLFNPLAHPVLAGERLFSFSLCSPPPPPFSLCFTDFLSLFSTCVVPRTARGPTIYWSSIGAREEDCDRAKRIYVLGSFSPLASFNIPPVFLPSSLFLSPSRSRLSAIPYAIFLPFPRSGFIFFQPLPRGALPVPGLCRGLGGKRVGLAIIPEEARQTLRIEQLFEISVQYPLRHRKLYLTAISPPSLPHLPPSLFLLIPVSRRIPSLRFWHPKTLSW